MTRESTLVDAGPAAVRPPTRLEDARLLAGEGRYVGDVELPGALAVALARSPVAHGILRGVDLSAARSAPGVVDAFAAADLGPYLRPLPARIPPPPGLEYLLQPPLAVGRVRYVGEPVAVVVAETRYLAEDAAQLIEIDVEPLAAAVDVESALAEGAPELFPSHSNLVHTLEFAKGDADEALGRADLVVSERFVIQRHGAVPLEPRGLTASFDSAARTLSIWGPTKMPHYHRDALANSLGLGRHAVRILAVDVGGGFGVRGEFHAEDLLVPIAAIRTGRAVRWLEDRSEHLVAADQSREQRWWTTIGLARDGRILALDARVAADMGAYVRTLGFLVPFLSGTSFLGPYRIAAYRCALDCVVTNKPGIGPVRSPGRYEANFARERLLDIAAARAGIDPVELRLRNLVHPVDMPHDTALDVGGRTMVYDGGDYPRALLAAVDAVGEPARARPRQGRRIGIGFACFTEGTGFGPHEAARLRWEPDSAVTVTTGTTPMGQGHATTLAQIAAAELGLPIERVEVICGDTALTPEGVGTFASRTAIMAGSAVLLAARRLRARLDEEGEDAPLEEEARFEAEDETFAYGASAAVVEVDLELGLVRVLRYVLAADVGTILNPTIVRGQIAGGAVQGIGAALLEEFAFSEDGQPLSTTFMDYLLASALDVPPVETILLDTGPADGNPLGVRGVGELGVTAAGAAVANAVADALGCGPTELPLKPDRVLAAARAKAGGAPVS